MKLNVKGTSSTEPYTIQLTTETTYYSTYFDSFAWINRGGTYPITLSLTHTNYFYEGPTQWDTGVRGVDAWDKVVAVHSGSPNWSNPGGLEDQFMCHVYHAASKNPWNIEPSRPDVITAISLISLIASIYMTYQIGIFADELSMGGDPVSVYMFIIIALLSIINIVAYFYKKRS